MSICGKKAQKLKKRNPNRRRPKERNGCRQGREKEEGGL